MKFWFFIAGMIEKSDSIAYDLLSQKKMLADLFPGVSSEIIARDIDREHYDLQITPWRAFLKSDVKPKDGDIIIYHYCDGWGDFEDYVEGVGEGVRKIFRWHNNTPPWFFMDNKSWVENTVTGFDVVINETRKNKWEFATNSLFSLNQLLELAESDIKASVVYPASVHLGARKIKAERSNFHNKKKLSLLFVGRVVPHKSHTLILDFANYYQARSKVDCDVHFAGRFGNEKYKNKLDDLARDLDVSLTMHGEVSDEEIKSLYLKADVFICFSQHEGFGLPVYEAMRYNKPVIAINTAAFSELLNGHPLCIGKYDREEFSKRLDRLRNDFDFYKEVLLVQDEILSGYSEEKIKNQLLELINNSDYLVPRSVRLKYEGLVFERSFDSRGQLYTRDDRYIFSEYINRVKALEGRRKAVSSLRRCTYFEGGDIHCGVERTFCNDGGWLIENSFIPRDTFIFFGPYISLRVGLYRAQISLCVSAARSKQVEFIFDVYTFGIPVIKQKSISVKVEELEAELIVDFYFSIDGLGSRDNIEFRCRNLTDLSEDFSFKLNWLGVMPIAFAKESLHK